METKETSNVIVNSNSGGLMQVMKAPKARAITVRKTPEIDPNEKIAQLRKQWLVKFGCEELITQNSL